jgi:hypothetical protein
MKIFSCGCSFTYGDELANPSDSAWPVLIARQLNATLDNVSMSGNSNSRIHYQTIKNMKNEYDLYLIASSEYSRFTFYKSENNHNVGFNIQLTHDLYGNKSFYRDWGKILYKEWYNDLFAFKLWLQQILQLQQILGNRNYVMINTFPNNLDRWLTTKDHFIEKVKPLINFNLMPDNAIFDEYNEIQYYMSLIDTSKFYKWNEFSITELRDHFPCGTGGHILEEGHAHLANLIYQHL